MKAGIWRFRFVFVQLQHEDADRWRAAFELDVL